MFTQNRIFENIGKNVGFIGRIAMSACDSFLIFIDSPVFFSMRFSICIFHRFFIDFGSIWESFGREHGAKSDPKRHRKNY